VPRHTIEKAAQIPASIQCTTARICSTTTQECATPPKGKGATLKNCPFRRMPKHGPRMWRSLPEFQGSKWNDHGALFLFVKKPLPPPKDKRRREGCTIMGCKSPCSIPATRQSPVLPGWSAHAPGQDSRSPAAGQGRCDRHEVMSPVFPAGHDRLPKSAFPASARGPVRLRGTNQAYAVSRASTRTSTKIWEEGGSCCYRRPPVHSPARSKARR